MAWKRILLQFCHFLSVLRAPFVSHATFQAAISIKSVDKLYKPTISNLSVDLPYLNPRRKVGGRSVFAFSKHNRHCGVKRTRKVIPAHSLQRFCRLYRLCFSWEADQEECQTTPWDWKEFRAFKSSLRCALNLWFLINPQKSQPWSLPKSFSVPLDAVWKFSPRRFTFRLSHSTF